MKNSWIVKKVVDVKSIKNPILIEGLPGIGNVGKIAIDFIIENKKAKKIYDLFSYDLPHSVFIRDDNLVELPKLEIYHIKHKNQDLLFLSGDVQPMSERSSYEFCETVLDIFYELDGKEIVTTGGIGLGKVPQKPRVFCTANDKKIIKAFKDKNPKLNDKTYGVVGPLIGATGLLVGMSKKPAIALLAETFAHPMYLGMAGARGILEILNSYFDLKLDLKNIDKEIKEIEGEILNKTKEITEVMQQKKREDKASYIG